MIQKNGKDAFPDNEMRQEMDARGKSLAFLPAEIDDLLSIQYSDKRLFALMSLIFSVVDLRNQFHIDHVFPISRFTTARLRRVGMSDDQIENLPRLANELPNLQLLEGPANIEKQAAMPDAWLLDRYPVEQDRQHYRAIHLLGEIPHDIQGCEAFWVARRERLREPIEAVLSHRPRLPDREDLAAVAE